MNIDQQDNRAVHKEDQPRNKLDVVILKIGNLLSQLFILVVVISFYEVVARYVFNAPTIWVHETASFVGGSLFVIGGAYALAGDRHVRVVLIYDAVSTKTRRYLRIFHHIAGLFFAGMLVYASWSMVANSWFSPLGGMSLETSGSAWNPPFPALLKGQILVISVLLFIQFFLHLIQDTFDLGNNTNV